MLQKIYFPNLNGLRFIAAFLVIIHHIEQFKSIFGLPNYWHGSFIDQAGKLGVILFFVLSGFLITYLLLAEKKLTKTISVKQFYMRRILRIWPLYYLIVVLGLFLLPKFGIFALPGLNELSSEGQGLKIFLFFIFMPNLALILFSPVPFVSQTWSVGVEEQFYLIWPVMVKVFKSILNMLILVIVFYILVKIGLFILQRRLPGNNTIQVIWGFWNGFSIDCMAIGGIAAWLSFHSKTRILQVLYHPLVQLIVYALTIFFMIIGQKFHFFTFECYAVLFAIIILNLASNPKSLLKLEIAPLNYLGKISYGLYMYHSIAIVISIKLLTVLGFVNTFSILLSSLLVTILIATLSYEFFEKWFIKLKSRYSKIISG